MKIILKDGTGSIDLKFLVADFDRHSNARIYFRRNGRKIRLRAEIGTAEFLAEYHAARELTSSGAPTPPAPKSAPVRGTLRWLVCEYYQSGDFKRLDKTTQRMRRRDLDAITLLHGEKRYLLLEPRHIKALRDVKSTTPHAANNLLKMLRVFFQWAISNDHMKHNPARDVKKIKVATEGHHAWTVSEIGQFMRRHPADTKAGLAIALLLYTGVRRSDLVQLGRQLETADGGLRLVETKGRGRKRKVTELPIMPPLARVLELHRNQHLTYLTTAYGAPFTAAGFGGWFKDRCIEAGLPHCSAHGLRKAAATIAAENGATPHELMAMFGWSDLAQATHYTYDFERKQSAVGAAKRIVL